MTEQMTIEQFGQSVKAKYPQYAKYSDADIGKAMLEKYPQYRSRVKVPLEPVGSLKPQPNTPSNWFQNAEQDLRGGGNRTAVGKTLGLLQGRSKGYEGLESGVSPDTAEFMGSVPLGVAQGGKGLAEASEGKPIRGTLDMLSGAAKVATIPSMIMTGPASKAATEAIPSSKFAARLLESVAKDAGEVPVWPTRAWKELQEFKNLAQAGGTMRKPVSNLISRFTNMARTGDGPVTYNEARKFYSNLTSLSAEDISQLNPVMRRQMGIIANAFKHDIGEAAAKVNRAGDYYAGLKEYANAAKLKRAALYMVKRFLLPAAATAGAGAAAKAGWDIYGAKAPGRVGR